MSGSNRLVLWLVGLLLVAVAAGYAYWFMQNFEPYSKEVRTDISPEARKNHFLAAEYFLQRNGQAVQSYSGRDIFSLQPSTDDTIFIGNHSSLFLDRNNDKLVDWVRAGGNLVLTADDYHYDDDKHPRLLDELGVVFHMDVEAFDNSDCDTAEENSDCTDSTDNPDTSTTTDDSSDDEEENKNTITVTFHTDHPGDFSARFLNDRYLEDSGDKAEVIVGKEGRPNLLRYSLGDGSVTILSDAALFTNFAIDKNDHAYLFYQLAYTPGKVLIFYSADMPSLLTLIWQRTPYLLITSVILLALAGWGMFRRSGPQLKILYDQRRNLLEHLDATAEYSWRIDKARQLFKDNRQAIEQAWRRRHPQLNILEQAERCHWIGEKTGLAGRAVERTLYDDITTEQDFIKASAVLQRLATRINQPGIQTAPGHTDSGDARSSTGLS